MNKPDRSSAPTVTSCNVRLALPQPECITLDNGIPVYVLDCGDTDVNRLTAIFDGGMAETGNQIVAQICLQLMREGCKGYTGEAIAELMDFNGAWIKAQAQTHHASMSLYSLNSKFGNVLPVFHDILRYPVFPDEEYKTMRETMSANAEIALCKVDVRSQQAIMRMLFGDGHPLAAILSPQAIREMQVSTVDDYHNAYMAYDVQPTLYLAGKINQRSIDEINTTFGKKECFKHTKVTVIPAAPRGESVEIVDIPDATQCAVRMAVPTITREHPDYIDLRCAIIGLGGYFGSRLMTEVRERQGLTYGISAALFGYPEAGVMMIASQTDNRSAKKLIEATNHEILRLQKELMGNDEFERLKRYIYTQLLSTLDNPFTIMDYYETLKLNFIADGYFQRQIDALRRMTPERLRRVMADHVDINKMKIAVAGNRQSLII